MTENQIRNKRKKIDILISKREGIYERAIEKDKKARKAVLKAQEKLYKLRAKCKHKFPNEKNPTCMGKGICEICGENDY